MSNKHLEQKRKGEGSEQNQHLFEPELDYATRVRLFAGVRPGLRECCSRSAGPQLSIMFMQFLLSIGFKQGCNGICLSALKASAQFRHRQDPSAQLWEPILFPSYGRVQAAAQPDSTCSYSNSLQIRGNSLWTTAFEHKH